MIFIRKTSAIALLKKLIANFFDLAFNLIYRKKVTGKQLQPAWILI